jgi:2-hydroxycyclohexanecarboxyl-CoA dehydrogenase
VDLDLAGKTVLVTGAGQGIGREIGLGFAGEGANVAFHYRSSAAGAEEARDLALAKGVQSIAVPGDLADPAAVQALRDRTHRELGPIDVLVNNAAYTSSGPFLDAPEEDTRRQVDVTVLGTILVSQAFLPDLAASGAGAVVTLAGDSGRVGESRAVVTSACRASAYGFTKALAKEFARDDVRANCVSLGLVRSPNVENHFLGDMSEDLLARVVKAYPLRRLGEMTDVVPSVLMLASSRSGWITGQVLSINGGYAT